MERQERRENIKNIVDYALLGITFVLLLTLGIYNGQKFIKLLPSVISLVVFTLSSRANRWTFFIGGLNSLLYAIGYFMEGVYASALSAAAMSFPLQMISFFCWKKNSYKQATKFRKMPVWKEIVLFASCVAACVAMYFIVNTIPTAKQTVFDAVGFVFGIYGTVLTMLAYMETLPFSILNIINNILLWTMTIVSGNAANVTYIISSCFSGYCNVNMCITWIRLYKEQKKKDAAATDTNNENKNI